MFTATPPRSISTLSAVPLEVVFEAPSQLAWKRVQLTLALSLEAPVHTVHSHP